MSRKRLQIDIETYSDVDLVNCGVYRYVEGDFRQHRIVAKREKK